MKGTLGATLTCQCKTAWRGKATCASLALRFAPAFFYLPRICVLSKAEKIEVAARVSYKGKGYKKGWLI